MQTVYVIVPDSVPDWEAVQAILGDAIAFQVLPKMEALSAYRDDQGVVLLGGEPLKVSAMAGMVRSLAPLMSILWVTHSSQVQALDESLASLLEVLFSPFNAFEVHARFNASFHLSELRGLIAESAQLDEITELYNYRFFHKRLGEEMALSKRHLSPVTVVILSVAYYDVYMDTYGYGFVSNMMRRAAQAVKGLVRKEDIVARLNENEIALLLSRTTEKGALTLAKRMIDSVEALTVYVGDQVEHLYLNAGIAGYLSPESADLEADALIRYGRHALHTARCMDDTKIQLFSELKPAIS